VAEGFAPLPQFAFLDLTEDRALIWSARGFAHRMLSSDPDLRDGWCSDMGRWTREWWGRLWPNLEEEWACPIKDGAPTRKRRRRRRRKR